MPVLYRTYRPQRFAEIIGQDRVVSVLSAQLSQERMHHGYLFAGPRGSGKTSMARVLAKSVNCGHKKTFEPCNRCVSCREVTEGRSLFVHEIDAASHRGIDEVRQLQESLMVATPHEITRIIILDEVHMLTKEAFNALLKLLEEPPPRVLFIFCTTEQHKVPDTVLSRVVRLEFRRLSVDDITEELERVAKLEQRVLGQGVAQRLAQLAEGALRDALVSLEEVFTLNDPISLTEVEDFFGLLPDEVAKQLIARVVLGDSAGALSLLREQTTDQSDHRRRITQLLICIRDRFFSGDQDLAKQPRKYVRLMQLLLLAERLSRQSPLSAVPLELAIIEGSTIFSRATNQAQMVSNTPQLAQIEVMPGITSKLEEGRVKKPKLSLTSSKVFSEVIDGISPFNHSLALLLRDSHVVSEQFDSHSRLKVVLGVQFDFHKERLTTAKNRKAIEEVLQKVLKVQTILSIEVVQKVEPLAEPTSALWEEALRVFEE